MLGDLKTSGEALLAGLRKGMFTLEQAPIDERNFAACVAEMQEDARLLASGLLHLNADLSDVEAVLGRA